MDMTITIPTSLSEISLQQYIRLSRGEFAGCLGLTDEMSDILKTSGVDIADRLIAIDIAPADVSLGFEFGGVTYSVVHQEDWCAEEMLLFNELSSDADNNIPSIVALYSRPNDAGWDRRAWETKRRDFDNLRADIALGVCVCVMLDSITPLGTKAPNDAY